MPWFLYGGYIFMLLHFALFICAALIVVTLWVLSACVVSHVYTRVLVGNYCDCKQQI